LQIEHCHGDEITEIYVTNGEYLMKIIIIGATGTIGNAVVDLLALDHDIVRVGFRSGDFKVDIASKASIRKLFQDVGNFDSVVSAAGLAEFGSLDSLGDEDYELGLSSKLMGQVNLVRVGREHINDNGSFTLTSGVLSQNPMPGSSSISMVNAGIEGFVRAAALEMQRGIRVNVISPIWVKETLEALGRDSSGGMPAEQVALAYKESVEGQRNGEVLDVRHFV
jgi:NAD(P)-dependent dehydrogenase (short-subunit alcohol dehydrogenase family)